jgi:hypothetical protein
MSFQNMTLETIQMKKPAEVKVQKLGMCEFLIYLWENLV